MRRALRSLVPTLLALLLAVPFCHAKPAPTQNLAAYISQWASQDIADSKLLNSIYRQFGPSNIKLADADSRSAFEDLLTKAAQAAQKDPATFIHEVYQGLDAYRTERANAILADVLGSEQGAGVDAVLRTGSSGVRDLEAAGVPVKAKVRGIYKVGISDDDITFVGRSGGAAAEEFNARLAAEGLSAAGVGGFDLTRPALDQDLHLIQLLIDLKDPEKFVGEAAMALLQSEMLEKGAVVAQRDAQGVLLTQAQALESYVAEKKNAFLTDLMDEAKALETVRQLGALTMIGSCERQITQVHGNQIAAKYILRERLALQASGSLVLLQEMQPNEIQAQIQYLRDLTKKTALSADDLKYLQGLREANIRMAFQELPYKIKQMYERVGAKSWGQALETAEGQRLRNEIMTGFALMREGLEGESSEQIWEYLKAAAGGDTDIFRFLQDAYRTEGDVSTLLRGLAAMDADALKTLLTKLQAAADAEEVKRAFTAVKAAAGQDGKLLANIEELEKATATKGGSDLYRNLLNRPVTYKLVAAALGAAGGAKLMHDWYQGWLENSDEQFHQDASNALWTVVEFVPGGMSLHRYTEAGFQMDKESLYFLVRDGLFLTPLCPYMMAGDVVKTGWDMYGLYTIAGYQHDLVEMLVNNGRFEKQGAGYAFVELELPSGGVPASGLTPFLFQTKALVVKDAVPSKTKTIPDVSLAANTLLDERYVPADKLLPAMQRAAADQINLINRQGLATQLRQAPIASFFATLSGFARWLSGSDSACAGGAGATPGDQKLDRWCQVLQMHQDDARQRRDWIAANVMTPQLIQLASQKRAKLDARDLVGDKIMSLQTELEKLRGSPLGVDLFSQIGFLARQKASGVTGFDAEAYGDYLLKAYQAYAKVYDQASRIPADIQTETGYDGVQVLQFKWNGDYENDQRRADQSRLGFAQFLSRMRSDIGGVKKSAPAADDPVDQQAFGLLGAVAFPYRVILDHTDTAQPEPNSNFNDKYAAALEQVRALYAASATFQPLLEKGASIARDQDFVVLDRGVNLELRFSDPGLQNDLSQGRISIEWSAQPGGEFRPAAKGPQVTYIVSKPLSATVTVRVTRRGQKVEFGVLRATLPIHLPEDFLSLALTPDKPGPNQKLTPSADIPGRFLGANNPFHVQWMCANCQIDFKDNLKTQATAPAQGKATVTVAVWVEDQGQRSILARASKDFDVSGTSPQVTATLAGVPAEAEQGASIQPYAANFVADGKPATGPFKLVWRSAPAGSFSPSETADGDKTALVLSEPGAYTVWAEIQTQTGGVFKTAGETTRVGVLVRAAEMGVVLNASPVNVRMNQVSNLTAAITGGQPPYSYSWTGEVSGAGPRTTFSSVKGGAHPITVTVKDAAGKSAVASASVRVDAVEGKIVGLDGKAVYGTWQPFSIQVPGEPDPPPVQVPATSGPCTGAARVFGDCSDVTPGGTVSTKPGVALPQLPAANAPVLTSTCKNGPTAPGGGCAQPTNGTATPAPAPVATVTSAKARYQFIFQSDAGLTFNPPQSDGRTRVLYDRMPPGGKAKIWADILQPEGEINTTVGETPQQEVTIVPPAFTINYDPQGQKVGKEVKASVTTTPPIDSSLLIYKWAEPPNSNRNEYDQNSSQIGFIPKDIRPVQLLAAVNTPHSERIQNIDGAYTPTGYTVKATVVGPLGPQPEIWTATGLQPLPAGTYAADQNIRVSAAVVGDPQPSEVHWNWTVNDGTTLFGTPISQEIMASRHETGTATLTVEARDANGLLLGSDSASFSVTVSAETLKARPFTVKAEAERSSVHRGETVLIRATTDGGKAPFTFTWTGVPGAEDSVRFPATNIGKARISLAVRDAAGKQATASLEIEVLAGELEVTLVSDKASLAAGESATLTAAAPKGKAPLKYVWQGDTQGQGASVRVTSGAPGSRQVSVAVTDSLGSQGTKSLTLAVKPLEPRFAAHPSAATFGANMPLNVELPAGAWTTVFHSEPEIRFSPPQASDGRTTALFTHQGSTRVWAEVMLNGTPAGRTAEDTIVVNPPGFEIVFDPPKATIGEQVTATVRPSQEMDPSLIRYTWQSPSDAKPVTADKIAFTTKNQNSVLAAVRIAAVESGAAVGQASAQFVPTVLSLKIKVAGSASPLPQVFRDGRLQDVTDQYAVQQKIRLAAEFDPKPPADVEYRWSLSPGCSAGSSLFASEVVVYRQDTGDCLAKVTVRTSRGGTTHADLRLPITIAQQDLDRSRQAQAVADATVKLHQAEDLAAQGHFADAVKLIGEAEPLVPGNAQHAREHVASLLSDAGSRSADNLDFEAGLAQLNQAAQLDPASLEIKTRLANVTGWSNNWRRAHELATQLDSLLTSKRVPSAERTLAEIQQLVSPIPAAPKITPWVNGLSNSVGAAHQEYTKFLAPLRASIQKYLKANSNSGAILYCYQALKRELFPGDEAEIRGYMQQATVAPPAPTATPVATAVDRPPVQQAPTPSPGPVQLPANWTLDDWQDGGHWTWTMTRLGANRWNGHARDGRTGVERDSTFTLTQTDGLTVRIYRAGVGTYIGTIDKDGKRILGKYDFTDGSWMGDLSAAGTAPVGTPVKPAPTPRPPVSVAVAKPTPVKLPPTPQPPPAGAATTGSIAPRAGIYGTGGTGQTFQFSAIGGDSMTFEHSQSNAHPPSSRSLFYGRGEAHRLGDGRTWDAEIPDHPDFCCGHYTEMEFTFLSSTSFKITRYRMWGLRDAKPTTWEAGNDTPWKLVAAETPGPIAQTAGTTAPPPAAQAGLRNLALHRPARESSRYSSQYDPQGGVDGVKDGTYGFHTDLEQNPWWEVDLGAGYALQEVRIFNRINMCADRSRTIRVLLSSDGANWRTAYSHDGTVFGGTDGHPLVVALQGQTARYVRLQLAEKNYLHLDEVEVYGQ
jgi:hypothetical protein